MSSARKKGSSSRGGTSARSGTSSARSGGGASARSGSGGTSRSRGSGDRHGGSSSGGGGGGGGGASNKSQPGLMEIVQHRFKKDVFESAMCKFLFVCVVVRFFMLLLERYHDASLNQSTARLLTCPYLLHVVDVVFLSSID